jgi:hypothetical protein
MMTNTKPALIQANISFLLLRLLGISLSVLDPLPLRNLFPVHLDMLRCADTDTHLAASDFEDRDLDVVADVYGSAGSARED